jgi:hypothetical protein
MHGSRHGTRLSPSSEMVQELAERLGYLFKAHNIQDEYFDISVLMMALFINLLDLDMNHEFLHYSKSFMILT